jgi:hypothetical protein
VEEHATVSRKLKWFVTRDEPYGRGSRRLGGAGGKDSLSPWSKDIQKRDLSRRYAKPKLRHLRHIAIDEFAIAKGIAI